MRDIARSAWTEYGMGCKSDVMVVVDVGVHALARYLW